MTESPEVAALVAAWCVTVYPECTMIETDRNDGDVDQVAQRIEFIERACVSFRNGYAAAKRRAQGCTNCKGALGEEYYESAREMVCVRCFKKDGLIFANCVKVRGR